MNQAIQSMLERYGCRGTGDYENALREIFQELVLLGLWRGRFFEHAAFYGGTALRILHGLERFSEDMDFSLLAPKRSFDFSPYCTFIQKELESWGFPVRVQLKEKTVDSAIESAFLKAETLQQMLLIEAPGDVLGGLHRNQILKIKVEVDTTPPPDFETESKFLLQPIPFAVKTYALPSLFAGKVHALLFRKWGRRVKGRDWFDLVWYVGKGIPVDLKHLSARMRQTGDWLSEECLTEIELRAMMEKRALQLDVGAAVSDMEPFLKRPDSIAVWSTEFFQHIAQTVRGQ
jgi:predicted nucleotidyltransferase component of viral defense system